MTYMDFTCNLLKKAPVGAPIYTGQVAEKMAEHFTLERKEATAATAVAFKRIMDGKLIPDLRFYQKGIYYRTISTPFGERGIDREQLVADKYLFPNKPNKRAKANNNRANNSPFASICFQWWML